MGARQVLLLTLIVVAAGMAAASGCGSSGSGSPAAGKATATPTPKPFAQASAVPLAVTTDANLPHWFILVNGSSIPSPMALFTPTVLTVTGTGPAGSPNPNGGTGVGLAPMQLVAHPVGQASPSAVPTAVPFAFTGAQVWQAAPGTQPGYYYLRSGESFTVDTTGNTVGSLMLGYGATEAVLDLGYLPSWQSAIYMDQSDSPTGDNSCFEQWSYDTSTAQLSNCNGGQLYDGGALTVQVGSGTSAPGNQWYAMPNYHLADVLTRPNASPLFPAWTGNQENAYNWVSAQPGIDAIGPCVPVAVGIGSNQASVCLTGIRNEYQQEGFQPALTNPLVQGLSYPSTTPNPFFAPADLAAVQAQLNLELTYVGYVQGLIGNAKGAMGTVFWENSNVLTKVVADLGVSANAKPYAVASEIVEGALYATLSALGGVAAFAANVMQGAVDTAAASQPSFEQEVGGTVGELAGNLNTQFNYLNDALTLDYNTIVYDWTRLSEVGPETQESGPFGLFWPDTLNGIIIPYMVNGYEITVMKALLPLTYSLHEVVGQKSAPANPYGKDGNNPQSYAQYAWDFGSGTTAIGTDGTTNWASFYNQGFWESGSVAHSYPDSTVMDSDLLDLGANPFEIFTGINGWSGSGTGTVYYPNLSCEGVVVTLFNDTPSDLWVNYTTGQGELSGPGDDYGAVFAQQFSYTYSLGGLKGTVWSELRPYGYTTMFFAQDNVTPTHQTGNVSIFDTDYSTTEPVASFAEGQDGCTADSHTNIHSGSTTRDNYSWSGGLKTRGQSTGEPGGVWGILINSTLSPDIAQR